MKKMLIASVCFLILAVSVFGQAVDKAQYKAIDPFDYKLDEDAARRGSVRKFKSVVEFISENKSGNSTFYLFQSLDKNTSLPLAPKTGMKPPSPGQVVNVYYSVIKRGAEDTRDLDLFEENKSKDEKEIGVVKSAIQPSGIKKSEYEAITSVDYRDDALFTQEGEDDRKFKTPVQFESQNGILYKFSSPTNHGEEPAFLSIKAKRRYPQFKQGQKMTVYFTASKEFKDFLILDDVE